MPCCQPPTRPFSQTSHSLGLSFSQSLVRLSPGYLILSFSRTIKLLYIQDTAAVLLHTQDTDFQASPRPFQAATVTCALRLAVVRVAQLDQLNQLIGDSTQTPSSPSLPWVITDTTSHVPSLDSVSGILQPTTNKLSYDDHSDGHPILVGNGRVRRRSRRRKISGL